MRFHFHGAGLDTPAPVFQASTRRMIRRVALLDRLSGVRDDRRHRLQAARPSRDRPRRGDRLDDQIRDGHPDHLAVLAARPRGRGRHGPSHASLRRRPSHSRDARRNRTNNIRGLASRRRTSSNSGLRRRTGLVRRCSAQPLAPWGRRASRWLRLSSRRRQARARRRGLKVAFCYSPFLSGLGPEYVSCSATTARA